MLYDVRYMITRHLIWSYSILRDDAHILNVMIHYVDDFSKTRTLVNVNDD